jgi:hypothetical protein
LGYVDGGRAPVVPWTRYYRGACAHGTFMALLEPPATVVEVVTADCPSCGTVELTTREPRMPGRT